MNVIGINGSSRKDGNTAIIIGKVFDELNDDGMANMRNYGKNMAWVMKRLCE